MDVRASTASSKETFTVASYSGSREDRLIAASATELRKAFVRLL